MGKNRRLKRLAEQQAREESAQKPSGEAQKVVSIANRKQPTTDKEVGLSGTTNWNGQLAVEANTKLQWGRAFGMAGALEFGEWEKILRTDHAASAGLEMVTAPLRDADVDVEPAGEDAQSILLADFVRDNIQEWLEPQWPDFINQVVKGALGYGFALHEVVYGMRPDARVPGGQAVYVAKLAQRLANSVHYNGWLEGPDGELQTVRQHGVRNGRWEEDIRLPAEKLLLLSWNREGNNYQGFSAFRSVWYICLLRAELLKIMAIGHQREACGIPVATMDKDVSLSDTQRTALQTLVENLVYHENAAAQLPPGVKLDWIYSPGANKGHVLETWKALGLSVLETLFSQQAFLGTSDTGSRAVGEVHADSKTQFVLGVKAALEAILNGTGRRPYTGLVSKILLPNFGQQAAWPKIKLTLQKPEVAISDIGSAIPALVNAGALTLTLADENKFRERLGLSPIDEAERALEREKKAGAAPDPKDPNAPPEQGDEDDESADPPEDDGAHGDKDEKDEREPDDSKGKDAAGDPPDSAASLLSETAPFTPKRPLRLEEQHLALGEMDEFLSAAREQFETDARDVLATMVAAALPQIRAAMADGDPSELENVVLNSKKLAALAAKFIDKARAEGYRQVGKEQKAQPAALVADRRDGVAALAAPPVQFEDDRPVDYTPEASARRIAMLTTSLTKRLTNRITGRLSDDMLAEATAVARSGGDPGAVMTRVLTRALDTRGLRGDAGSVLTTAFSMGREQFARERADEVSSAVISGILDRSICDYCLRLDGTELEFGTPDEMALTPPFRDCAGGDSCRCLKIFRFEKGGDS